MYNPGIYSRLSFLQNLSFPKLQPKRCTQARTCWQQVTADTAVADWSDYVSLCDECDLFLLSGCWTVTDPHPPATLLTASNPPKQTPVTYPHTHCSGLLSGMLHVANTKLYIKVIQCAGQSCTEGVIMAATSSKHQHQEGGTGEADFLCAVPAVQMCHE